MGLTNLHITAVVLFICISPRISIAVVPVDYYWRDYTGVIPEDAVPGGYDMHNRTTYIGQGYLRKYGIIPGTIYPGKGDIVVSMKGAQTVDTYVKILCSPHTLPFNWIPVEANEFHVRMIDKRVVVGGVEDSVKVHIGRIALQGEVLIGKIVTDLRPDLAPMSFANKGNEFTVEFYEVLTYDPKLNLLIHYVSRLSGKPFLKNEG